MSLIERLRKQSTIKESAQLDESKFFNEVESAPTKIPALNIAISGSLDGGLKRGLTIIAGPSRHFKSLFCLIMAQAYMEKYKDSVLLFMDSEFGTPKAYFESVGIDTSRVIHCPVTDIEQLKHELMTQLNGINRGDHVIIIADSIGNLASKKEVDDAISGSNAADMTRARAMKSLGRMITPLLTLKDIPMLAVGHVYQTLEMYAKTIMSGGTGLMLSADNVWFVGRQQEKDSDKELVGYNFIINIEKSRHVKEKSKIPIMVKFDGGISRWSGLLDIALESGHVIKPKVGWYQKVDKETGEISAKSFRAKDTDNADFWIPILTSPSFQEFIKTTYQVTNGKLMTDEDIAAAFEDLEEVEIEEENV